MIKNLIGKRTVAKKSTDEATAMRVLDITPEQLAAIRHEPGRRSTVPPNDRRRKAPEQKKTIQLNVSITPELAKLIDTLARQLRTSKADLIERAVRGLAATEGR